MTDTPKYLHATGELGAWFAAIGRALAADKRAGVVDDINKMRHHELHEWLRDQNAAARHHRWWQVYSVEYDQAHHQALADGCSERQAFKRARAKAEHAVIDAFPDEVTTTRGVREAFRE